MKYCLVFLISLFATKPLLCSNGNLTHDGENIILEAYELRINGKANEAKELLTEFIMSDSTDAHAYFELARTKQHLFLGGEQISWDEIVDDYNQAVRYASENEVYSFYYATACFTNAYLSLMRQQPDAGEMLTSTCDAFEDVLRLNPGCREALLYLVDIYGVLPENMGGNRDKAATYADELNKKDWLYGALANARLLSDAEDNVSYWQELIKENGSEAQLLEELGRAYLFRSDTENGTKYFQEAINTDISRRYLTMHLVRYHLLSTQQNPELKNVHLEEAEKLANSYLNAVPELLPPVKAHALQILSLIKNIAGDNNSRDEYLEKAASYDPFYSRATGTPSAMLYCPPDEVKIHYSSFFLPF